jgi:fumarate reductase subunit D
MSAERPPFRIYPFLWLGFSGGGVIAAAVLPPLVFLFAFAFPFGWIDPPEQEHLKDLFGHPLVFLALFGMVVPLLIHAAHRFRYTLYDGLQVKHKALVATLCYGSAFLGVFIALDMLGGATA